VLACSNVSLIRVGVDEKVGMQPRISRIFL
jgi:hypothetical protein